MAWTAACASSALFLSLLLFSPASSEEPPRGYRFHNSKSFVQLPSHAVCGEKFALSFQFLARRDRYTLLLLRLSDSFNTPSLALLGDDRGVNLTLGRPGQPFLRAKMAEQRTTFHSLVLELQGGRLKLTLDGKTESMALPRALVKMGEEDSAQLYLGTPFESQKLRPTFQGVIRNVIGKKRCDCVEKDHLHLKAIRAIDLSRKEACAQRNPCTDRCLCVSSDEAPTCRCDLLAMCEDQKNPEPDVAAMSFDFGRFGAYLFSAAFNVVAKGNVSWLSEAKVGGGIRLLDNAFLNLGTRYDCYGDLERCPKGLTISLWLRPSASALAKGFTLLSSRSFDVFCDAGGRLRVFFKTRDSTWHSRGATRLREGTWQRLELAWSTALGLIIQIDGKVVEKVPKALPIDTKFAEDARLLLGASGEIEDRGKGGFDVDELRFWQLPPWNGTEAPEEPQGKIFDMKVSRFAALVGWPNSQVSGSPGGVSGPDGLPALELSSAARQFVDVGAAVVCAKDRLVNCQRGFAVRLWFLPIALQGSKYPLLFSNLFEVHINDRQLLIYVHGLGKTWSGLLSGPVLSRWSLLEVSWSPSSGLEVFIDSERVLRTSSPRIRSSAFFGAMRLFIGSEVDGRLKDKSHTLVRVSRLETWPASLRLLRRLGKTSKRFDRLRLSRANERPQSQPAYSASRGGTNDQKIDHLQFNGNYVRYDLSQLVYQTNNHESLRIEFSTEQRDGLLWYAVDGDESTYLYLKDGKLVYEYKYKRRTNSQAHTLSETMSITPDGYSLHDGQHHTVDVSRFGKRLSLVIDKNRYNDQMQQDAHGEVRILVRNFAYLGGVEDPRRMNTMNFRGKVYDVLLKGDRNANINLVQGINRYPNVNTGGQNIIVGRRPPPQPTQPYQPPPPQPPRRKAETVVIETKPVMVEQDDFSDIISSVPVPYTFNTPEGLIRLPTWQFQRYKSMEIEFLTYEPRGVLFYAGPGNQGHKDFVCIEIFDGILYFVYNHGGARYHVPLSEERVDNGRPHIVYFSISKIGMLTAKFNGRSVPLPGLTKPHQKLFRTYTYIGSLDSFSPEHTRAPWDVWSREGFVGCVNYIKLNDGTGFADARKFQNQHSTASKKIGSCDLPKEVYCADRRSGRAKCGGFGVCQPRWYRWRMSQNFYCDCSYTTKTKPPTPAKEGALEIRGHACSDEAPIVNYDGQMRTIVSFLGAAEYTTHTDDISVRFKTRRTSAGIFTTTNLAGPRNYLDVYLDNGRVMMQTNVFDSEQRRGASKTYIIGDGMYADDRWHTVYIRRRANHIKFWVDNERPKQELFPPTETDDYRLAIKHIYLGNFNNSRPNFVGSLSNFYWNPYDFLHNPEQENVYIVKTTGIRPTIPPVPIEPPPIRPENPITIRDEVVYIIIQPTWDVDFEAGKDSTFRVLFRTKDPDGLLFYLKGQEGNFMAAELQGGRMTYSYNLGDGIIKTPLTFTSNLNDGRWHQIFVHVSSVGTHSVWVDSQKMNLRDVFRKVRQRFVVYLAGVPSYMWSNLPSVLQTRHTRKGFIGCLSMAVFNTGTDLLNGGQVDFQPARGVTMGQCIERKVCTPGYCRNGGQCQARGFDQLTCDCDRTGYRGERCEERIPPPQCPPNFCGNGGTCYMVGNRPTCECRSTGYTGARCETKEQCPPNYCRNGGICSVQPGKNYVCDCSFTGWSGQFCDKPAPGIKIGYDKTGYVVYPVDPPKAVTQDKATIGFQTWTGEGTILTFVGPDGKHWDLVMKNGGQLFLNLSNGRKYPVNVGRLNDGRYHIINLDRDKDFIRIRVDGREVNTGRYIDIVGPNGDLTYSKLVVGADRNGKDEFVGAIGGFHWNGKYPLQFVPVKDQRGTVEIVVTPIPNFPRPKPKPACSNQFCSNGGRCYQSVEGLACNCTNTAFTGPQCNIPRYGIWSRDGRRSGYLIYTLPPVTKESLNVELGFQSWDENGPIMRIVGDNDMYWQLNLGNGYLYLDDNGEIRKFNLRGNRLNDGRLHWLNLRFKNNNVELFLDGQWVTAFALSHSLTPMRHKRIILGADTALKNFFTGIIGGVVWNGKRLFTGVGGPQVGVSIEGDVAIVRIPQDLPRPIPTTPAPPKPVVNIIPNTGAHGGIVWTPVVMKKIDGAGPHILVPGPGGNTLRGGGYGTGGIVMAGVGPVVAGASLFTGLGAINPLAAGLVLATLLFASALLWAFWRCKPGWCPCCATGGPAGGGSGLGAGYTRIPAMLAKPFSTLLASGKAGAGGAGGGAAAGRVNIVKIDTADVGGMGGAAAVSGSGASAANGGLTATSREMHTLNISGGGAAAHSDNISVKSVPVGVNTSRFEYFRSDTASDTFGPSAAFRGGGGGGGGGLAVGRDDRFGTMGSTYHMEAMGVGDGGAHHNMTSMETTTVTSAAANALGNNVFLNEEIKVDCCQITANSKYVVTGSSTGPPQVWDMKTGDLIKVMDGHESGCTDLHLACGDSVLVAQVLDDMAGTESMIGGDTGARRHRRLQLWDFATGGAMEMPTDIMCTSTCVTWAGEHVVIAKMDNVGPSILVWDLFANEAAREIRYHHPAGMSPDAGVTFLNVTPDDQLVVGGYTHSIDGQANYMVFDLDGPGSSHQPIHPVFMVFDANLECTELLATPHEAITGTRKGELLVWDLPTAKVLRSVTITAQLERAGTHTLTPHNGEIRALSLSRDGQYLVTGATDRMVKVWTMVDEKMVLSLDGHTDDILSVCISDDNEVVVSGSWDGSIRVWRMRDGSQMCWFTSNIEVFNVKVSHDKSAIVALGERGGHRKLIMLQIIRNRTRRTRPRIASAR